MAPAQKAAAKSRGKSPAPKGAAVKGAAVKGAASKSVPSKGTATKRATSPVYIRELELEDLPAVYALGERLFTAERWPSLYRTWDEYELAEFFASEADNCFVAEDDDDRLIGFILGTIIEKRRSAWTYGWVLWLGVDPEIGRGGIASKLLERITERFCEEGVRILLADTDPQNEPAVAFFEKNGFGHPRSHVYLSKNLSKEARPQKGPALPKRPGPKKRPGLKKAGTRKVKPR